MGQNFPLALIVGEQVTAKISRRVRYAFQVFCAVYGFQTTGAAGADNPLRLCYGSQPKSARDIALTVAYVARDKAEPAIAPSFCTLAAEIMQESPAGTKFPCFHPVENGFAPDWLGEIFEWISGAHEYSVTEYDPAGRIPFAATLHGKYQLDPEVPYAAIAMRGLNRQIRMAVGDDWPEAPISTWNGSFSCAVVASHDLDFLPVSFGKTAYRFFKNLIIAVLRYRDRKLGASIMGSSLSWLLGGPSPFDCLPAICKQEQELGISSTHFVICRREHSRDASYELNSPQILKILKELSQTGGEIAVHGSYTSLEAKGRLAEEYQRLAEAGYPSVGGRQHWLRYNKSALFDELRDIGACYDSSAGYSCRPGFRHGACFPYPPYDFGSESAYPFLEIPLVIMDTALYAVDRRAASWRRRCEGILKASRTYGWGGISILWHNDVFHGARLPREIADLYWQLKCEDDSWMRAKDLVEKIWPDYEAVGLLPPLSRRQIGV